MGAAYTAAVSIAGSRISKESSHLSQIERGRIRRPDPAIVFELAQVYGLNYALVAEWAGYVDARLPVDADLLYFVVRTFVGLDANEQEKALVYLKGLRDRQVHGTRGPG